MSIADVRLQRDMPFLKVGMKVYSINRKEFGKITGTNRSLNINVKFDGEKHSVNMHPEWMIRYIDTDGSTIREYLD
ncbi:hypothetical protein LMH73_022465 [Vibrio splendidus]|nr:hypothetical protein [Vibrio splendidus]MCC4878471.1 hypothetical protein [Vibrio splendidus]